MPPLAPWRRITALAAGVEARYLSLELQQVPLPASLGPRDAAALTRHKEAYTTEWAVLLWSDSQLRLDSHGLHAHLPADLRPGLQRLALPGLPGSWRVWVQDTAEGGPPRRAMVLVPLNAHAALGREIADAAGLEFGHNRDL